MLGTLSAYQGVYVLTLLHLPDQAGTAGLAVGLCAGLYAVYQGLAEHLTIHAVRLKNADEMRRFLKRSYARSLLLSMLCLGGAGVLYVTGSMIFKANLWEGGTAFIIYGLSAVVVILHAPAEALAHYRQSHLG